MFNLLLCTCLTVVKDHEVQTDGEEGTRFHSSVFSLLFNHPSLHAHTHSAFMRSSCLALQCTVSVFLSLYVLNHECDCCDFLRMLTLHTQFSSPS